MSCTAGAQESRKRTEADSKKIRCSPLRAKTTNRPGDDILMEKLLNFTALGILAVLAVPMRLRK